MPGPFFERMAALVHSAPGIRPAELGMGLATLALLVAWPRFSRRLPGPLVALALAGAAAFLLERFTGLSFDTVHDRFSYPVGTLVGHGIPRLPPAPCCRGTCPERAERRSSSARDPAIAAAAAFTIAMLGAIESLLSAVVADGMTGKRHDPDTELVAQGLGNFVAPFFGGIAATGAIARTATNVRAGARSPIAAVVHSLFVLVAVMVAAPVLGWLPMSALAAMLLHVAWRISEARLVLRLVRRAPGSDLFVLATCFFLTVVFDMVVAVGVGIVLASLLFMRRMADVASVRLVSGEELGEANPVPPGWMCYELAGPLFFGAAQKAMSAVRITGAGVRGLVFDLRAVPMLDATGIVALEATVQRLEREGVFVVLAGVQPQPLRVLARAGFRNRPGRLAIGRSFEQAMDLVGRTRFPDAVDGEPPPT
ncbi:MAG: SulP family inorganic anion transporter [Thermoanaerobaculia bacterium]